MNDWYDPAWTDTAFIEAILWVLGLALIGYALVHPLWLSRTGAAQRKWRGPRSRWAASADRTGKGPSSAPEECVPDTRIEAFLPCTGSTASRDGGTETSMDDEALTLAGQA